MSRFRALATLALSATLTTAAFAQSDNADPVRARARIAQARTFIQQNDLSFAERSLNEAEKAIAGLPDAEKGAFVVEIAKLRDELAAKRAPAPPKPRTPAPAAPTPAPTPAPANPPKAGQPERQELVVARARINQAKNFIEQNDLSFAQRYLDQAEEAIANLPDADKAPLAAEIAELRKKTAPPPDTSAVDSLVGELDRKIGGAESAIEAHPASARDLLDNAAARLKEPEVVATLGPDRIKQYEAKLAAVRAKLGVANKAAGLDRAGPILEELEQRVSSDPFKGQDQMEAYRTFSDINYLGKRVEGAIGDLPADDPQVKAVLARLAAARQKLDAASIAWGKAQVEAQVSGNWEYVKKDIAGWEDEQRDPKKRLLDGLEMPKTELAIRRIAWWLNSDDAKRTREENKNDAAVMATFAEAERTRDAAAKKLNDAFDKLMAEIEKLPLPLETRMDLDRPALMAYAVEQAFEFTPYQEANVARIRKVDARWKAELAEIMRQRKALYDQLAAEADKKWPDVVAAADPVRSFDIKDPALRGKVVLLSGFYNRAGWDFGRDFDLELRVDGTPVGGNYEKYVLKALETAWYEQKLDVSDHIPWDALLLIEGPGQVRERTNVRLISKDTGLQIGTLEEWRPIDGVRVKVIALRAGPVCVGPNK
jgi:flagellin-specific chaperone FliS